MKLDVGIKDFLLAVYITNDSSRAIRVWEQWNYWGWQIIHFIVRNSETGKEYVIKRNPDKDWTLNFPSFIEISKEDSIEFTLKIHDGDWIIEEELLKFIDVPLLVKAVLEIKNTPEATEHGIFVGKAESGWIESRRPHRWLGRD